jgi:hypothetical protein
MRWVAVVACAGCNSVLGVHATHLADAPPPPPGCAGERFQGPSGLPELDNAVKVMAQPTLTGDTLELWFGGRAAALAQQDLYFTTRASVSDPFAPPQLAAFDDPTSEDYDPAITADGLDLFFVSTRLSGARLWETTRSSRSEPFGTPREIGELAGTGVANGFDVSKDGNTLYYVTGVPNDLYMVSRVDRMQLFDVDHALMVSTGVATPGVSPDGLELFFNPPLVNSISRRTRASRDVPFDNDDAVVQASAATAEVSADATELFFANGGRSGFEYLTRPCP